jgi:phosphatidylglycerol:prolipoprotein diacylglycerol transferase
VRPVLFSVFGLDIQSYGVSKALAALAAALLLARAFERLGLKRDSAYSLVLWAAIWGFVGAKIYYLLEHLPTLTIHDLGGMGFTWYGGLIGGVVAALVIVRRHKLPLGVVAGAAAVPLTVAYGKPTSVPWAMSFPNGVVPIDVPVHPTPLYEALAALVIAALLWSLSKVWTPPAVFGAYLALSGIARFLVEYLRINEPALLGLTQPQLWALVSVIAGVALIAHTQHLNHPRRAAAQSPRDTATALRPGA